MDEDEVYIPMQEHFVRAERHSEITGAFFNLFTSMTPKCLDFDEGRRVHNACGQLLRRFDSIAVRLPFDCNSTALYDHSTTFYVTTISLPVCGLLHCGLNK